MKMETEHRQEQLEKSRNRIQREIQELSAREQEVRRMPQSLASGKLKRTTSTPQILEAVTLTLTTPSNLAPKMTNGVISARTTPTPLRFATTPSQKGLMNRFLATRGKIYKPSNTIVVVNDLITTPAPATPPAVVLNPLNIKTFNKSIEIQFDTNNDEPKKPPARKGYVPVEEKIQKELNEMRERENELRLMRSQMLAKSQPNLLDIGNDNDSDIYDGASSLRSGTSSTTLNEDEPERENKLKHKANPRRRSTLIARWESLIASKKETSENGNCQEQNNNI